MNEELIKRLASEAELALDLGGPDAPEYAIRLYQARYVAPLVEAVTKVCATWSFYGDTTLMAQLRTALAPFQQEALSALAEADGPYIGEAK